MSRQTVSNYLNGRFDQMGSATRTRVAEAFEELQFHPSRMARGLRTSQSRTLGFLVLDEHARFLADPLTDLLLAGVGDVARRENFGVLIRAAGADDEGGLVTPILERAVDGAFLVLSGPRQRRLEVIDKVAAAGAPFVVFDEPGLSAGHLSVRAAEREGAMALTQHLVQQGRRHFAFVAARVAWAVVEQRYEGYCAALAANNIKRSPRRELFEAGWEPRGGYEMGQRLLAQRTPPDAIVCGSDLLAAAVMRAVEEAGFSVGEDIAVVGFDDFPFSAYLRPALTTVSIPAYDMGAVAAEKLIGELAGGRGEDRSVVFDVELKIRASG